MPRAGLYPIALRIEGKPCLVVGGGAVALRKARGLAEAGARVRVVSPRLSGPLPPPASWVRRRFRPTDVRGTTLAFACTDDPETNRAVARACGTAGVHVNVADAPDLCTFYVPAVVRKGDMVLGISTGGASPALARRMRLLLARFLDRGYPRLATEIRRFRDRALREVADPARRRRLLRRLASDEVVSCLDRGGLDAARRALVRIWTREARP